MFYTLFVLMMLVHSVQGHAILTSPKPRTGMSVGNGEKFPGNPTAEDLNSCKANGKNTIPGPIAATYAPGGEATIKWDLKIAHANAPGVRIAIQYPGEQEFQVLAEKLDVALLETKVQLPAKPCDNCVLQWIWHSTADGGFYVGCSDIAIKSGEAAAPVGDSYGTPMAPTTGASGAPAPPTPAPPAKDPYATTPTNCRRS